MIKNYGLTWAGRSADDIIIDRLNRTDNPEDVFQWILEVKDARPEYCLFMDFIAITGLRFSEAVQFFQPYNSTNKIIDENGKQVYEINPENINFTDAQLGKFNAFRFIENFMKDPDNGIAVDGKEPEWIRKAYTWIDETNPNDPLYFSVAIEHKNPKIFLMLNPHLNQKIKKGV